MRRTCTFAAAVAILVLPLLAVAADPRTGVVGDYVEARTAEVFTGGCIMSSEAETVGKQALMAWRITRGAYQGVELDGLAMVAALAADRNLGIAEMGGEAPQVVKSALMVDSRATVEQRDALVALARSMAPAFMNQIVEVKAAPVRFVRGDHRIKVAAEGAELIVNTHLHHDPGCGAMQWFHPLVKIDDATLGMTEAQSFSGGALGVKWSDPDKRSSFFGTFTF